jgi:DNA helicase-2/ATP-dependent DNA helicase PcrA
MPAINVTVSPAIEAARKAQSEIHECIANLKSFLLEAGAGAGKTYSLIQALAYLIDTYGNLFVRNRQQIACITYTNVASKVIHSRTDGHPAVLSSTIHSFCWALIKDFQSSLRSKVPSLPKFDEKLATIDGKIGERRIEYELGQRTVTDTQVGLWHNDVIDLTVSLMEEEKFRMLLVAKFPIIFVDEYQDTNKAFAAALKKHFLDTGSGPLIGFFGDQWQKIYSGVCGKIEHPALSVIKKGSNFRSAKVIVDVLNRMRPELPQAPSDERADGTATVYCTNSWPGIRRTEGQWKGDLPADVAHQHLEKLKGMLISEGWSFDADKTKILMLTNNLLAAEQGYEPFAEIFTYNESFLKKEDPYIAFLTDTVEPLCAAYLERRYGDMFALLDSRTAPVRKHSDKEAWKRDFEGLLQIRKMGTVGDVLAYIRKTQRPRLSEIIERSENQFDKYTAEAAPEADEKMELRAKLGNVAYSALMALDRYIDDKTPFATKHGVKGEEFENVLVVVGRGWNMYDFNQMLEWLGGSVPADKEPSFERNRNLFYVACSRPKKRLCVLFTQKLSDSALKTLRHCFGNSAVRTFI